MLDILEKHKEISMFLNDENSGKDIDLMKRAIEEKKFLLCFVGQFSAGKSKLINNIIGKELLPVHSSESTQVVTFIKYGKEEHGSIVYKDLSIEDISIGEIRNIWQGQKQDEARRVKEINYIEIYVESRFLSKGLIIADTPGVNTIINEHEKITNSILKASEEIIYVMSKPLTDVDKSFLKQISQMGINISCVRTFMDKIKSSEENVVESVLKDRKLICDLLEKSDTKIYHVSNEVNNEWFKKIDDLKHYISSELASNVCENVNKSCRLRLNKISKIFLMQMEQKKKVLKTIIQKDTGEIEEKRLETEAFICKLENKLELEKRESQNEIKEVKSKAKKELKEMEGHVVRDGKKELTEVIYSKEAERILKNIAFRNFNNAYLKLQQSYINAFDEMILEKSNDIKKEIKNSNIHIALNLEESVPSGIEEIAVTLNEENYEVGEIKKNIAQLADIIEERESKLKECNITKEKFEEENRQMYEMVGEIEEEISKQGSYKCKLVESENQALKPSEVLQRIGSVLDWATLLIPGKAYVGIASKVGKYSSMAGKAVKAYKEVDSTKDLLFMLQNIEEKTRASRKRTQKVTNAFSTAKTVVDKAGILDMLTFQHWFEKVGSNFDKPLVMEVDKEYENEYKANKERLSEKYAKAKKIEIEKLQALGLIENEEEKLNKTREIDEIRSIELSEELEEKEKEIRIKAINTSFDKFKNNYVNWFESKIAGLCKLIEEKSDELLENSLLQYVEKCTANIIYEINRFNENTDETIKMYNENGIEESKNQVILCDEYSGYLKKVEYERV